MVVDLWMEDRPSFISYEPMNKNSDETCKAFPNVVHQTLVEEIQWIVVRLENSIAALIPALLHPL